MSAKQQAVIISAFACCGKSYAAQYAKQLKIPYAVIDLDSSGYSHKNGKKNENFVNDYMKAIKGYATQKVILLVSTHAEVRNALNKEGLWYALVYPQQTLKAEWLKRMTGRGSPASLVAIFDKNWDAFVSECMRQQGCVHFALGAKEHLSDILAAVIKKFQTRK